MTSALPTTSSPVNQPRVIPLDLTRQVPAGMELRGLSQPQSDGKNYYRTPLGQQSEVLFTAPAPAWAQFEYHLYSPGSAVTGQLLMDGQPLGEQLFPAGLNQQLAVQGSFVAAGRHTLTLVYRCLPACQEPPLQYWTKLTLVEDPRVQAAERGAGLGVQQLWLNAPQSVLDITGAAPMTFDGANFRRPLEQPSFTLTWPQDMRALNVGFTLNGSRPFRASVRIGDKVIDAEQGDEHRAVHLTESLVPYGGAHAVTVQVECLDGGKGCASLYFPRVSVLAYGAWAQRLPLALAAAFLLIGATAALLRLRPGAGAGRS